jgi:hypothetical protein
MLVSLAEKLPPFTSKVPGTLVTYSRAWKKFRLSQSSTEARDTLWIEMPVPLPAPISVSPLRATTSMAAAFTRMPVAEAGTTILATTPESVVTVTDFVTVKLS